MFSANSRHRTVYRWLEKKFNRHILKNVNSAGSKIRSSLRNSVQRTKSKVTPAENTADGHNASKVASDSRSKVSGLQSIESDELYRSSLLSYETPGGVGGGAAAAASGGVEMRYLPGNNVVMAPAGVIDLHTHDKSVYKATDEDLDYLMSDHVRYKAVASTKSDTKSERALAEFGDDIGDKPSRQGSYTAL